MIDIAKKVIVYVFEHTLDYYSIFSIIFILELGKILNILIMVLFVEN